MSARSRPPRLGRLLLRLRPLGERREDVEADLLELFAIRTRERGRRYASWRYCSDALSLWRPAYSVGVVARERRLGGIRDMRQDIIFGVRLFRRQPGLFGVTIAGLALAIGLSSSVFSIVNAFAFRGPGISAPESVFRVTLASGIGFVKTAGTERSPTFGNWAYSDYARLQQVASSLTVAAAAADGGQFRDASDGRNEDLPLDGVMAVSGNYFLVLGVRASIGRTLTPRDDTLGAPRAIVVSHAFWKNRLGADASIVGRTVWLRDRPFTVVGVTEGGFTSPTDTNPPAMWMTLATHADVWREQQGAPADGTAPVTPWNPPVDVLGRIRPGVARVQAESEVTSIAAALGAEQGRSGAPWRALVRLESPDRRRSEKVKIAAFVMTIVGLVVLLACANVTNLLLASAAGRRREIGTRLALGAGRARVVRQLLTESLVLGCLGGVAGLMVTYWLTPFFAALIQVPPTVDVSPDLLVYAFLAIMTMAVGTAAGLAPARFSRRGDLASDLKADQSAAPSAMSRSRLRSILTGGQAAASVVLLVLAALLTRSLVGVVTADLGFDAHRLFSVSVGTNGRAWDPIRTTTYWDAALERVRQLPGVAGASLASMPPFSGDSVASSRNGPYLHRNETTADYFNSMGIRVLRGRSYTADEVRTGAPVAMISATLADEFWGVDDPIGSSLERVWGAEDAIGSGFSGLLRKPRGTRIVGVVADTIALLRNHEALTIYLPLSPLNVPRMVVRTQGDPRVVAGPVQEALRAIDRDVRPRTNFASEGLQTELKVPETLALLAGIVGASALWLAVIGLFGVTAFVVEQRRHEVSVRMTLGANRADIVGMLLRDSLQPVIVGLAVGLVLALVAGRLIQVALYGISAHDPIALLAAVVVLLGAATAAVLVPARRAARTNPAQILRQS